MNLSTETPEDLTKGLKTAAVRAVKSRRYSQRRWRRVNLHLARAPAIFQGGKAVRRKPGQPRCHPTQRVPVRLKRKNERGEMGRWPGEARLAHEKAKTKNRKKKK